jgi:hypothetical protein
VRSEGWDLATRRVKRSANTLGMTYR